MSNENYIVINGKKVEFTEEQLKAIGIEVELKRNNPFGKIADNGYYYIANTDVIYFTQNIDSIVDEDMYNNANYFNDKDFANQVMLHQKLYRKLLKYAWDNEAEDCVWNEDGESPHYYIYFDIKKDHFDVGANHYCRSQNIYFSSEKVAKQAIEDVVEPFMKEYPEFVW